MKQFNNCIKGIIFSVIFIFPFDQTFSGNPQRAGQAGAAQLLINPWARTSGWAGANLAGVRGVEGVYSNVAGLAFTEKTELVFASTSWLQMSSFDDDHKFIVQSWSKNRNESVLLCKVLGN